jgi:hypothetical protein
VGSGVIDEGVGPFQQQRPDPLLPEGPRRTDAFRLTRPALGDDKEPPGRVLLLGARVTTRSMQPGRVMPAANWWDSLPTRRSRSPATGGRQSPGLLRGVTWPTPTSPCPAARSRSSTHSLARHRPGDLYPVPFTVNAYGRWLISHGLRHLHRRNWRSARSGAAAVAMFPGGLLRSALTRARGVAVIASSSWSPFRSPRTRCSDVSSDGATGPARR